MYNSKAHEKLGATLHKMGLKQEALSAYESALNICNDPLQSSDLSEKRLIEALNNAAQAASAITPSNPNSIETAEKYFRHSVETNKKNADT